MSTTATGWALTVTAAGHLEQLPVPNPTPAVDEVVVAVTACGIGEEDRAVVAGEHHAARTPIVLGREVVGVVEQVGVAVTGWRPGDRVAVAAPRPCRRCLDRPDPVGAPCGDDPVIGLTHDGGAARWLRCAAEQLVPLPPELDDAAATRLAGRGPYARAYRALARLGIDHEVPVVVRGLGAVGLAAVALAGLAGAEVVGIDAGPHARRRAEELGAQLVLEPGSPDLAGHLAELTDGGVLRALVLSGSGAAAADTLGLLRPGGRVVLAEPLGDPVPPLPRELVVGRELQVVGAGTPTVRDLGELVDLAAVDRLTVSDVGPRVGPDEAARWLLGTSPTAAPVIDLRG